MSQADAPAADWYPDPSGRFQFRYWDGEAWTGHVSTDGATDWDPPGESAPDGGAQADAGGTDPAMAAGDGAQDTGEASEGPVATDGETFASSEPEDAAWAPTGAADDLQLQPDADGTPEEGAAGVEAEVEAQVSAADEVDMYAQGGTIEEGEPADTNLVANQRAGLDDDVEAWLGEVAKQVEPRLSRIEPTWAQQPQAEAARACAYGLLVGHLAHRHPHMRSDLSLVAESHPSFTTLEAGSRLDTLEQIAGDPQRTAAWLGPLIGNEDVDRVTMLFD